MKQKNPRVTNADIVNILIPMQNDIKELKETVALHSETLEVLKKHFPEDFK